jgi:hypothetical protein
MATVLSDAREIITIITALAACLAGAIFGLYKYKKAREAESAIQIEVALDTRPTGNTNIVQVTIHVRNLGKAAARVYLKDPSEGAICRVRTVTAPPGSSAIPWDGASTQDLIPAMNYMADWFDCGPGEPMFFEPNFAETFHVLFSTDYHGPIWVRAELTDSEDFHYRGDGLFVVP